MSTIALIDTRLKIPGESLGTVVSTHDTIRAAFKANEAFSKADARQRVKDHVPTKIVTLKVRLGATASMSIQACTCFRRGKVRAGVKGTYYNITDVML